VRIAANRSNRERAGTSTPSAVLPLGGASDAIDKDTELAILSPLDALRESMKNTSGTRIVSLRIHDALLKARVPSYVEVCECSFDRPLSELTSVENKLAYFLDAGIHVHRNNFTR
jgi:hypothetical protein